MCFNCLTPTRPVVLPFSGSLSFKALPLGGFTVRLQLNAFRVKGAVSWRFGRYFKNPKRNLKIMVQFFYKLPSNCIKTFRFASGHRRTEANFFQVVAFLSPKSARTDRELLLSRI